MLPLRTQPAGPKAFRLYALIDAVYRQDIGEATMAVYEALTYYVDPKTLTGKIPLKLLAQTLQRHPSTVRRHLTRLAERRLIAITPQWDSFECVREANAYTLGVPPVRCPRLIRPRDQQTASLPVREASARRLFAVRRSR